MKTFFSCYTDSEAMTKVKALAQEAGVPIGDLVALMFNYGYERLSIDKLRVWAASQPSRRGPLGGGMKKEERAVSKAIDDLWAIERVKEIPTVRFETEEIARDAGLRIAVAYNALAVLKSRGLVMQSTSQWEKGGEPILDRWGRVVAAHWWRAEHELERQGIVAKWKAAQSQIG